MSGWRIARPRSQQWPQQILQHSQVKSFAVLEAIGSAYETMSAAQLGEHEDDSHSCLKIQATLRAAPDRHGVVSQCTCPLLDSAVGVQLLLYYMRFVSIFQSMFRRSDAITEGLPGDATSPPRYH